MLPRLQRLRRTADFRAVSSRGRSRRAQFFRLTVQPQQLAYSRFGIIVPNKVIKTAAARNKIKRQVRAALARLTPELQPGYDVVLLWQHTGTPPDFAAVLQDMTAALRSSGVI